MKAVRGTAAAVRMHRAVLFAWVGAFSIAASMGIGVDASSLAPDMALSRADFFVRGPPSDELASWIATGNWNSDGFADIITCSLPNGYCRIDLGRPNLTDFGNLGPPAVRISGSAGARWGSSASIVGDINGDGDEDLVVGAPDDFGVDATLRGGSVAVFFNRGANWTGNLTLIQADVIIRGLAANDRFGQMVAPAGDVDGDGNADFWVAAPAHVEGALPVGAVYLIRGQTSWASGANASSAAWTILGSSDSLRFGDALAGGNDLNGDAVVDVAIGAPRSMLPGGARVGAVSLFFGPLTVDGSNTTASAANVTIWGIGADQYFGWALSVGVGYFAPGSAALGVGAPRDVYGGYDAGSVFLFNESDFASSSNISGLNASSRLYGATDGEQAGTAFSLGGDVDGDGRGDVLVGAPFHTTADSEAGKAYLLYGGDAALGPAPLASSQVSILGSGIFFHLGASVTLADFSGDGLADLVAGAPRDNQSGFRAGGFYGFLGRERERPPTGMIDADGTFDEGAQVTLTLTSLFDPDGDVLSWAWDPLGNGSFGWNNLSSITVTYPDNGTYRVSVRLSDGQRITLLTLDVAIANVAPSCNISTGLVVREGSAIALTLATFDPGVTDNVMVNWTAPAGVNGSGASAFFVPGRGGTFYVAARVADKDGASSTCSLTVQVENVAPSVNLTGPTSGSEGDDLIFMASVTDPGADDVFSVEWKAPGAVWAPGALLLTWTAFAPGAFQVQVRVTDLDGAVVVTTLNFTIANSPPQAELVVPTNTPEGDEVLISVRQLAGGSFDSLTAIWGVCQSGNSSGLEYFIARAQPGVSCVRVIVEDDDGASVTLESNLTVTNLAPLAAAALSGSSPFLEGETITANASRGAWETSTSVQVIWYLDGEVIGSDDTVRFGAVAGNHTLRVTGSDALGGWSEWNLTFSVTNMAPVLVVQGPETLAWGATGTWTAVASDASGAPPNVTWLLDGRATPAGLTISWLPDRAGPHTLSAVATDGTGATTRVDLTVEVLEPQGVAAPYDDAVWLGLLLLIGAAAAAIGLWRRSRRKSQP